MQIYWADLFEHIILLYPAEPKSLQYFVNSAQYRVFKLGVHLVYNIKLKTALHTSKATL